MKILLKFSGMLFICMVIIIPVFAAISGRGKDIILQNSGDVRDVVEINADWPYYDTAKEITERADLIFVGTIREVEFTTYSDYVNKRESMQKSDTIPENICTVDVEQVYKGVVEDSYVIVRIPGSGVYEGVKYENMCGGTPDIQKDGKYLFLASEYEKTCPGIVSPFQGIYNMDGSPVMSSENYYNGIKLEEIIA